MEILQEEVEIEVEVESEDDWSIWEDDDGLREEGRRGRRGGRRSGERRGGRRRGEGGEEVREII